MGTPGSPQSAAEDKAGPPATQEVTQFWKDIPPGQGPYPTRIISEPDARLASGWLGAAGPGRPGLDGPPGNHQARPPASAGAHQPHGGQRPTQPRGARASLGRPVKAAEVKEQGRTAREDGGRGRGLGSPGTSARPCPLAQAPGPAPRSPRARSQAAGKCECQHGDATFLRSLSRPRGCRPRLGPARKATLVGPGLSCPPPAAHPWNALLPASRGFGCPRGPPAGPRLSSVFPGGLRGCRCLQRAGYFGGHPLKENRAGMLEAEHPVPEAWVWPLEPGRAEGEGRGHRGQAGAGGRTAPGGSQGRPSEVACPSAKLLTSWASFSRLQGGQRGVQGGARMTALSAVSSSVVPCVLVRGCLLSFSRRPVGLRARLPVHPQGEPGAEIRVQKE